MADIQSLEREIRSLQAQLRQQNIEAEQARQRLTEENRRRLMDYETQMRQAIERHDREVQAKYERLLSEYQRALNQDVRSQLARTDEDYQKLLKSVKKNEAALRQKNQELEQAINELKNDASKHQQGSADEAWAYLQSAVGALHAVQAKPHEKFMPKRLDICLNSLKDGNRLFGAGLYEAAAAVAVSSESALERLGYSIDDKISEWDAQYDLFCLKLRCLEAKIQQELTDWASLTKQPNGGSAERRQDNIELNYWSGGEWAQVRQTADESARVKEEVERTGREGYWQLPDGASADDLKRLITAIDKADGQLAALSGLCGQRYAAACRRAEWGEAIIDFFTAEINLEWLEPLSGYKAPDEETATSQEFRDYAALQFGDPHTAEDMREWLRLVFANTAGNRIYIYLLPLENDGKVTNRVILHIDYGGAEQEFYSRDIYAHVCEAIRLENGDGIVNYASDVGALKASRNRLYRETGKDLEQCVMCNS